MKTIPRPRYIQHITGLLNKGMMIILVGQRRVGKSCLLHQLEDWLHENRPDSNVVYIDKELQSFRHITNAEELYDNVVGQLPMGTDNYLLVDEVQDIENYEDALRSLHAEERCQVIATGSNAYIFSGELSTRLAGRYFEVPVYSLDYREFLEFHGLEDSDSSLRDFLRIGGLPGLRLFPVDDEAHVMEYLNSVYSTVMLKDVLTREQVRNVTFIENLSGFLADNVGKLVSTSTISGTMISQGEKVTPSLTSTYLKYLCNALLVDECRRYDIHGRKVFEQIAKYYFSDHGLRNFLCGFNVIESIEKIMENVVYNHLRVQGFEVFVGVIRDGEVDFVAKRGGERLYVQVTHQLSSEATIDREFGNLQRVKDASPKYVVSMDPFPGEFKKYPGIRLVNLRKFLMTDFC